MCSLGAFGGPEAHMSVFLDQMVVRKRYLTEEDLVELIALCSILPGPTSTQTIVAIGHKTGGPVLAFLTMLVWALPVLIVMTVLSFLYQFLSFHEISSDVLRFIGPMAVGFIVVAAYRIGRKVVTNRTTAGLLVLAGLITWFIRDPWIYPLLLVAGGIVTIVQAKESQIWTTVSLHPPWKYLVVFGVLALGGVVAAIVTNEPLVRLTESFFRYGYLVFGGGQVVVPLMYHELVDLGRYMTNQEFLTGYGLVQGLPGPMFSFAAYAGGMAARGVHPLYQVAGALAGGIGIFLPGLLLIYFVYPVWEQLKAIPAIRIALRGIAAVAGGLIAVAALIVAQAVGYSLAMLFATGVTVVVIASRKIPAPFLVAGALAAGFLL